MRFVVLGSGAIGGSVGALLARAGDDVLFVARGAHGQAMREHGLYLDLPDGGFVTKGAVVGGVGDIGWRANDVVLLAVKSQDVELAIRDLPPEVPVVCMTNGIAAERIASARVKRVYGAYVFAPASHLRPGRCECWAAPVRGVIDIGAFPHGTDSLAANIAAALRRAGFASADHADIMRSKRGKLLLNLGNILEALCEDRAGLPEIEGCARAEGVACFGAAGWTYAIDETRFVGADKIRGAQRPGGSTWQSLARGKSLEVGFLNGEIAALGRQYGVATPVNTALERLGIAAANRGIAPGTLTRAELAAALSSPLAPTRS